MPGSFLSLQLMNVLGEPGPQVVPQPGLLSNLGNKSLARKDFDSPWQERTSTVLGTKGLRQSLARKDFDSPLHERTSTVLGKKGLLQSSARKDFDSPWQERTTTVLPHPRLYSITMSCKQRTPRCRKLHKSQQTEMCSH